MEKLAHCKDEVPVMCKRAQQKCSINFCVLYLASQVNYILKEDKIYENDN